MKVICIDFDNTIADTGSWKDGPITASPLPNAINVIRKLSEQGYTCIVLTARQDLKQVSVWLKDNGFVDMEVTNKKPIARAYIDDRGIRFTTWNDMGRYFL